MTNDRYTIRTMSAAELDIAVDWAAKEGWNPGLADATCFRAQDPGGFLLGALDGEPIASISVVRYGSNYGFLGFYICVPEERGKGYGLRLWEKASERLAANLAAQGGDVSRVVTDLFGHVDGNGPPTLWRAWPVLRLLARFLDDADL